MQLIAKLLAFSLILFSLPTAYADSFEDFDLVPNFPNYACVLNKKGFEVIDEDSETLKKLNSAKEVNKLSRAVNKTSSQIRRTRTLNSYLLIDSPQPKRVRNFRALLSLYFSELPELNTISDRFEALVQLKTLLRSRLAALKKNFKSINNCQARNTRTCFFYFDAIGNLDSDATPLFGGAASIPTVTTAGSAGAQSTTTYEDLDNASSFFTETNLEYFSDLNRTVKYYFFKTTSNTWVVRAYVDALYVDVNLADGTAGLPRMVGSLTLSFDDQGALTTSTPTMVSFVPYGSPLATSIDSSFYGFQSTSSTSNITLIDEDAECFGGPDSE